VAPCPIADTALQRLIGAADRSSVASTEGLEYRDGRVLVQIDLSGVEGDVAWTHDVGVTGRFQNRLTGFVTVANLCGLAADTRVTRVFPVQNTFPR
jgi:hypothetical protein